MEFALTRKQLNKKRGQDQTASAPPTMGYQEGHVAPPAAGQFAGVDPATGLPTGYDPPPPPTYGSGSEFFTSGSPVLGQPASPGRAALPIDERFGQVAPPGPPPPVPGPLQGQDGLLTTLPVGAQPESTAAYGAVDASTPNSVLIEGVRPKGAELAASIARRYIGFILVLLVAVLMIAFLPSLRHSSNSPSGLGPTAQPQQPWHQTFGSASGAGWVAPSAAVVSISTSYR